MTQAAQTSDVALAGALALTTVDAVERDGGHDAIVVGAGAVGGLAAALLCEAGLKVLVLDAGWRVPFWQAPARRTLSNVLGLLADPRAMRILPPNILWRSEGALRLLGRRRQPVQSECYAWPTSPELFVDDLENPYETPPDRPFCWIRAHGLGGRMVVPTHGRQYMRHSERDFRPVDGLSPPWPFEPEALDVWYDLVEARLALSGRREGSRWLPDSRLGKEREPTAAEAQLIARLQARYPGVTPILGRHAPPLPSLALAAATGRLLCRQGAVVRHVDLGPTGRVEGVTFFDRRTGDLRRARAPLVFLGGSTLETTRILLSSDSDRTPGGIGARSGALGSFLMDHVSIVVNGVGPGLPPGGASQIGQCLYLPRFDARESGDLGGRRGFGMRVYQTSGPPGSSYFTAVCEAEMLPAADNRVALSAGKDAWGLPTLRISARHGPLESALAQDQAAALAEVSELAGARLNAPAGSPAIPGSAIHEVGTARMGDDPASSVVDPNNQAWEAPGLYVTDGACFPSEGLVNPTLTMMALTARACDHAVRSR